MNKQINKFILAFFDFFLCINAFLFDFTVISAIEVLYVYYAKIE